MPDAPERDPLVEHSIAGYVFLAAILLVLTLVWALWQEFFGLRPWKGYEREFAHRYSRFLAKELTKQEEAQKAVFASAEYQALRQKYDDLNNSIKPQKDEIENRSAVLDLRIAGFLNKLTDVRAYVAAHIYSIEHISTDPNDPRKQKMLSELKDYEKGPFEITVPVLDGGGKTETLKYSFDQLEGEFSRLQASKAGLQVQEGDLLKPLSELNKQLDQYLQDHIEGLTPDQVRGLETKMTTFDIAIRQINNPDAGIVDRCESCHLGVREPETITPADMPNSRVEVDAMSRAFVSHPDLELLKIHDPTRFGCSPCHNGNGMQVDSVEQGHGEYEHWLRPLYHKENFESGCQQCHASDMAVDHAPALSRGKELFQWKGCVGCHRFQGYDPEPEDLVAARQSIQQLEQQRAQAQLDVQRDIQKGDSAPDNETARKFYLQADVLRVSISNTDSQIDQLDERAAALMRDVKKVAPDLKEARAKFRPEWLPVWISNPHAWRPTTKMPRFRLTETEVRAVAAFIWQDAPDVKLPHQPPGDPARGKESFETRGCMGCHSVGEGSEQVGGWFAANLTRVGEKDNYDYLVRWVHNPRERSAPYCPYEKRDVTEADYRKHGLPFVFDLDHNRCPNDGHTLQVEQMTVMPSLRLSWQEARDIASYLLTLRKQDPASYEKAPYLTDASLKAEGRKLVLLYGCAGCHEIAGLEDEGRIGTELTREGSKPFEQLDFGLWVKDARDHDWYNHKGFFERKLAQPETFDRGVIKAEGEELRMPNFFEPVSSKPYWTSADLKPDDREQVRDLSTLLLGSVTSEYPERYFYLPADQRRDIQEGWWIVKKYNCMGCHEFTPDQSSVLMTLPRYQTPEWKDQLPPKLMTEGARVQPDWLARFLSNPALSQTDLDRDGVRSYLRARMPTFFFSANEARKLVRFFQALSHQPLPFIPQKLEPLTTQEVAMARALFTSPGAPCLKCHATGDASHDRYATAPNFLLAPGRLKPEWTKHWILDPSMIAPGTAMPSGLFRQVDGRWVFAGPTPALFKGYNGDHADLLVRYMFEITLEEQRRLVGMSGAQMKRSAIEKNDARPAHPASGPTLAGGSMTASRPGGSARNP